MVISIRGWAITSNHAALSSEISRVKHVPQKHNVRIIVVGADMIVKLTKARQRAANFYVYLHDLYRANIGKHVQTCSAKLV